MTGMALRLLALLSIMLGIPVANARSPDRVAVEASFRSEPGVTIAGTLELPPQRGTARVPVMVVLQGHGRWTRGGFDGIRNRLLAAGVGVLIYDKRGLGQSTGSYDERLPVTERDAEAAIAWLRGRPEVDGDRIMLMGMSHGAAAAPEIALRDPKIAGVVMLSGPVGPKGKMFIDGLRASLSRGGMAPAAVDAIAGAAIPWMDARARGAPDAEVAALREKLVAAFVGGGFAREQAQGAIAVIDTPLLLSMYQAGTGEALAKIRVPILIVLGSDDPILAPAAHLIDAQNLLRDNPDALVVGVPGADHGLGRPDKDGKTSFMSPALDALVAHWLIDRLVR